VKTSGANLARVWRYHYDRHGNRVLAQENVPVTEMGQTRKALYNPDSNALLAPPDLGREYAWNAQGQLIAIRQENRELARYRYNHRGLRVSKQTGTEAAHTLYNEQRQRIADLDSQGKITRQYLWLGDHLIATLDAAAPKALQAPADGFIAELTQTVSAMWNSATGNADRLAFVHVNHLGAPVAATDEAGQTVWQADYAPYGKVIRTSASASNKAAYTLALRYPGQWEDAESGLYYNDFRYYDPTTGRYLSPDPLGRLAEALGSPNAYAYVNNNPLSYIDPWGLILFAFDGTGNDESDPNALSNVVGFRNLYQSGTRRYVTGVGTEHIDNEYGNIKHWAGNTLDSGANYTGPARIARMVQYFNDEATALIDDEAAMDVDIIGFSRGAAQARDFANRLVSSLSNGYYRYTITGQDGKEQTKCQKVNFRFMGLYDTVLSTNLSSYSYNLGIPEEFLYVAQAVALNEYRGKTLRSLPGSVGAFPLESIMDGMYSPVPIAGQTRIERGFLGSHSDIGGGFEQSALADVALVWMVDQATAAGVSMSSPPGAIIANPVLHDKSDNLLSPTGAPLADGEDRQVRYGNGSTTTQRAMIAPSGMNWSDTGQFISYLPRMIDQDGDVIPRADFVTGTVDAQAYLNWLNANGYNINMTVQ
jgi:RHS repeat-associated protein